MSALLVCCTFQTVLCQCTDWIYVLEILIKKARTPTFLIVSLCPLMVTSFRKAPCLAESPPLPYYQALRCRLSLLILNWDSSRYVPSVPSFLSIHSVHLLLILSADLRISNPRFRLILPKLSLFFKPSIYLSFDFLFVSASTGYCSDPPGVSERRRLGFGGFSIESDGIVA